MRPLQRYQLQQCLALLSPVCNLGLGALLGKLQIRYARAYYQNNTAYNQFGINMQLNQYFGLGKWGGKIGW
jgi:hypothetical protein